MSDLKRPIQTNEAPSPIGPYSQAVVVKGDLLFCSGQIPLDVHGEIVRGDVATQTKKVMENIQAVLKSTHCDFCNVVKSMIFLTNMDDFPLVNEVYSRYFDGSYPARSCVEVSRLPKGVHVEIEVIAVVKPN